MKKQKLDTKLLDALAMRAHYYAIQMVEIANHQRPSDRTDPKVGGHPAACASALHILGALHLVVRNPSDMLAIKPHASPTDHAFNFMMGNLFRHGSLERLSDDEQKQAMHGLRKFSENGEPVFQSYHSGWDPDGLTFFPSGSVGIPPVNAAYLAHAYRFAEEQGYEVPKDAHFWALIGDSEFREGSLYEAIPDASEREVGNLTWIVDYNRQSLDGHRITHKEIMGGTDDLRIERTAVSNGWEVIQVRHGRKRLKAFQQEGGELFRNTLETKFEDYEYQSLLKISEKESIRETLLAKEPKLKTFLSAYNDDQLYELMIDLGGHDFEQLIAAMEASKKSKRRPTLIVAHTVKGWGLECMGASGNHSALPSTAEVNKIREERGIPEDDIFKRFEDDTSEAKYLKERGDFLLKGHEAQEELKQRNKQMFLEKVEQGGGIPEEVGINLKMVPVAHTQWMLGQISAKLSRLANTPLDESKIKKGQKPLTDEEKRWKLPSELYVTMAPDVGTSTNLNPNMDGKIFGPEVEDFESEYHTKDTKTPDIVPGEDKKHRHLRFEIAEGNAMSCVGSYGKLREFLGIPIVPLMTVYDFFIKRALDQFFYNLYWNSSFIVVGTPAGVSLSPEGAQHGWKSDFQIPNTITWEPMFAQELDWVLSESIRRHVMDDNQGRTGVLIRLVTRGVEQGTFIKRLRRHRRFKAQQDILLGVQGQSFEGATDESQVGAISDQEILDATRTNALSGAYYLVDYRGYAGYEPGDNVVNIFAMGTMGTEALEASDRLLEKGIYANVIMVSSPDLLVGNLGHENDYHHLRNTLGVNGELHLNSDMNGGSTVADVTTVSGRRVPIVSVHDGEPGLLDNIGSIVGVRHESLAVRKHSKSGRPNEIYAYHKINADAVVDICGKALSETALEKVTLSNELLKKVGVSRSDQDWQELWPQ